MQPISVKASTFNYVIMSAVLVTWPTVNAELNHFFPFSDHIAVYLQRDGQAELSSDVSD